MALAIKVVGLYLIVLAPGAEAWESGKDGRNRKTSDSLNFKSARIIVSIERKILFYNGELAKAYPVGIPKRQLVVTGCFRVGAKRRWPEWRPTKDMMESDPSLPAYVPGGVTNPLGAAAIYLYQSNIDTRIRIHGTADAVSVGEEVSSGCIRMLNTDINDLYDKVRLGHRVCIVR